jgi:hypothetical protein
MMRLPLRRRTPQTQHLRVEVVDRLFSLQVVVAALLRLQVVEHLPAAILLLAGRRAAPRRRVESRLAADCLLRAEILMVLRAVLVLALLLMERADHQAAHRVREWGVVLLSLPLGLADRITLESSAL